MLAHGSIAQVQNVAVSVAKTDKGGKILFKKQVNGESIGFAGLELSNDQVVQLAYALRGYV